MALGYWFHTMPRPLKKQFINRLTTKNLCVGFNDIQITKTKAKTLYCGHSIAVKYNQKVIRKRKITEVIYIVIYSSQVETHPSTFGMKIECSTFFDPFI